MNREGALWAGEARVSPVRVAGPRRFKLPRPIRAVRDARPERGLCLWFTDALRSSRLSSSLTAKAALLGVRGLVARGTDSFSVRAFKASRLRVQLLQTLAAHGPEMVTVSFG